VNSLGKTVTAVCEPATIIVKGKTAVLDAVEKVYTEEIDVSQISESTEVETTIQLPDGLFYSDEITTVKVKLSVN